MDCNKEKNEYGFSAEDVREYREQFGVSMSEAKKHFIEIYRNRQRDRMRQLIESGTHEDVLEIVKILMEEY